MAAPHRQDLPAWSCVNEEVKTFNRKLKEEAKDQGRTVRASNASTACSIYSISTCPIYSVLKPGVANPEHTTCHLRRR